MKYLPALAALVLSWAAVAQTGTVAIPQKHIPPPVLLELRTLETQFDQALLHDCAPERCSSKGCVYGDHVVVDMPRSSSLPGIAQAEGPGSAPAQEYLTLAHCDFAHEKSVSPKDVQALVRRLEQRLSKGWLKVTVGHQLLEPVSPSLSESPPAKVTEPPKPTPAPLPASPPAKWEAGVALRELWLSLLPHFAWMIALVLVTAAALLIIWALRRLGRETLEEQTLRAQLAAGSLPSTLAEQETSNDSEASGPALPSPADDERVNAEFIAEQQRLWSEKIARAELAKGDDGVVDLLREWLKTREFGLLAKAIFAFGDRLSLAFSSDGELAIRKVEFADYLKQLDPKQLPSDATFFRTLNQHSISSSLLSQADADIYRSLREEFGSMGITHLIERLENRYGALLFALVPSDGQDDIARLLSPELRVQVAAQLLVSNRISAEERHYLFEALDAARTGRPLPKAPGSVPHGIIDRGREYDAAGALSVLFPYIEPAGRQALFRSALQRSGGVFPAWYEDILYPDMVLKLPEEVRADVLLEVDPKALAGWTSVQSPAWQERFMGRLGASVQNLVRANMAFDSRADQLRMASSGRNELVAAVKRRVARGKVTFEEIVS